MRVLVVDDEQLAREELCYQLDQLGDIEIVGQAATAWKRSPPSKDMNPTSCSWTSRCPASAASK